MPDFTSSAELEYITWKAISTYIADKMLRAEALSWGMEGIRLKSAGSWGQFQKLNLHPQRLYNLLRLQILP